MDLSVSVPHPHATLLLSPSASMLITVTVIDVATMEEVEIISVVMPHIRMNNHRCIE